MSVANPTPGIDEPTTAVVTGASRGFGRAIAAALVANGHRVIGIAREEAPLLAVAGELGEAFVPLVGDATDEAVARDVVRAHVPRILVLNAGAGPHLGPIQDQTWETFSVNWHVDTRQAFTWTRAALREPLAPGSFVLEMSSGAALGSSPLSGGYAAAKSGVRFIRNYAAEESERAGLGIRFVTLFPMLSPGTRLGLPAIDGYAERAGIDRASFIKNLEPALTPEIVGKSVLELAADRDSAAEYRVDGTGLHLIG